MIDQDEANKGLNGPGTAPGDIDPDKGLATTEDRQKIKVFFEQMSQSCIDSPFPMTAERLIKEIFSKLQIEDASNLIGELRAGLKERVSHEIESHSSVVVEAENRMRSLQNLHQNLI